MSHAEQAALRHVSASRLHAARSIAHDRLEHRVILIGPGQVGSAFIEQLARNLPSIRLIGLCNRRHMLLDAQGISTDQWPTALAQSGALPGLDTLTRFALHQVDPVVLVDCTAALAIGQRHGEWLQQGISVLTANKHGPCSLGPELAGHFDPALKGPMYGIETTVGAALPVIQTTRQLIRSGHGIQRIDGLLSGSLSAIFNHIQQGLRPSEAIRHACQGGLTEPDPRDDLSGLDIARKLVILARELGHSTALDSVELPELIPDHLRAIPVEAFLGRLTELDRPIEDQIDSLAASHERVQICGSLLDGQISVSLTEFPTGHPFAEPAAGQSIVQWHLNDDSSQPVCVQGAGAGASWTASGLIGELSSLIRRPQKGD